jgi:hypothetical protein
MPGLCAAGLQARSGAALFTASDAQHRPMHLRHLGGISVKLICDDFDSIDCRQPVATIHLAQQKQRVASWPASGARCATCRAPATCNWPGLPAPIVYKALR